MTATAAPPVGGLVGDDADAVDTTGPRRPSWRNRRRAAEPGEPGGRTNWWLTGLMIFLSLSILVPMYLVVVTALKTPDQLSGAGFDLPSPATFGNFGEAWRLTDFPRSALNSAIITVGAVTLTLLTNSMVAYAIARNMHRRLFKGLFFYFIAALFVPFPILMLTVAKLTAQLHLDNQAGLILLYTVFGLSFNVFVYVAYIHSIPKELEEAAIVDGANAWTVFWKVIFPLLRPMNATVGIITCVWAWNDFMLPLVILSDPEAATLPLQQYVFQAQFSTNYTVAFASYLLAMVPLLVVYVLAQRWVISGVTRGAIK
ncbi:carbohydrate ABC transporter permease [Cellulomonas sp. H30R-01]|uniref:ABC transporter permease n=1 Tax=Cellulomonas algicola TaxID=2071633 RepID=A0A401UXP8_9CELL|nr:MULTISPECIES: carbohydrate ABC transporter permease [Cellulomonas]QHT55039.1 carbohydrate ABC transporter permease [Cellulomonas sp. H30R-01]GCD19469.1 ABC transporter permease [Cellulomonas algicola]